MAPLAAAESRLKPVLILLVLGGLALYLIYHFVRTPVPTGSLDELPPLVKQVAARIDSGEVRIIKKPEGPAVNNGQPPKDETAARVEEMERQ